MTETDTRVLVTMPPGLRDRFFTRDQVERLETLADVTWNRSEGQFDEAELARRLPGTEVAVTGWGTPAFTEEVLSDADDLELLAHTGGSVASLATDALYDRGVAVCSANRPMARFVAEATLGHVLAAQRDVVRADRSMRAGDYERFESDRTLFGATVGLVGLGTVGRYLLSLLAPFDVTVRLHDPYVPPVDVTEYDFVETASLTGALEDADVVSVHASRTPETVGLLGAEELGAIPDGALFVNTARAEIVDREALSRELSAGRIRAALDVYHEEPLPADSEFRALENVQLSPHLAGNGPYSRFVATVLDEIERHIDGGTLQHEIPREQSDRMTR